MEVPAISVVIPLYNAEKYIGECLDSLLLQTFKNFEVIVVDDCSTDNSVGVVKSYAPKFNGRLKLTQTKKNSGSPGEPSNIGINFSRGEYLFIMDDDDAITPTAFAELYPAAKKFNADVVACEKFYEVPEEFWHDEEFRRTLKPFIWRDSEFVTEPTPITNDLSERMKLFCQKFFLWNVWSKLLRRKFILNNKITFTESIVSDFIFTSCLVCSAEKFFLVPNVVNYYRFVKDSASHKTDDVEKFFRKYFRALIAAFRYFDKFLSGRNFFQQHPDQKYIALEKVWNEILTYFRQVYEQLPAHEFDKILREEFSAGDNVALSTFAFNAANVYRVQLRQLSEHVNDLKKISRQDKSYIAELEKLVTQLLSKTGYKKSRE